MKRRLSRQLFDLHGRFRMQLFHRRACLYTTCHIMSYVCIRPTCFHTSVLSTRRVLACVHTLKDGYVHTFWLTKTCLCVPFNIRHHVCYQISHRRSRNDLEVHDLTYEHFSVCNFSHTKQCVRTLDWPTRRTVMRVHCDKTSLYTTFWLTWTFPHANLLIRKRVCIQLAT